MSSAERQEADRGAGRVALGAARDVGRPALLFSAALAFFILVPPFLKAPFPGYEALRTGDVVDLLTPVVVVPLAWFLLKRAAADQPGDGSLVLFLVFAALWIQGQSMHLAANAIANFGMGGHPAAALVYDLDEVLSHYLWHAGTVGITGLVAVLAARVSGTPRATPVTAVLAASLFAFTFFAMVVEGGTAPLGVPAAVVVASAGIWIGRRRLRDLRADTIIAGGYGGAVVLFFVWAALNDWRLVQFSEAGIL